MPVNNKKNFIRQSYLYVVIANVENAYIRNHLYGKLLESKHLHHFILLYLFFFCVFMISSNSCLSYMQNASAYFVLAIA